MKKENKKTKLLPDYAAYEMTLSEKGMVFIFGFFVGFAAIFALYSTLFAAIPAAFLCGFLIQKPAKNWLLQRKKQKLLMEFRDFLDSLQGSFSAGKNLPDAIGDTAEELARLHGAEGVMTREAKGMQERIRNGMRPDAALQEFAGRADLDDVRSFADTVQACASVGGDLRSTVRGCREILCDRILAEQEIRTALSQTRIELYILSGIPFLTTLVFRALGNDILQENTPAGIAVKTAALGIFVCAIALGIRISRVKV